MDYSQITEHIYVGAEPLSVEDWNTLLRLGIGRIINLTEYAPQLDPAHFMAYLWLPIPDNTPATQEQFKISATFLKMIIDQNHRVYVHCGVGHGRAPMITVAYLAKVQNMSVESALNLVRKRRPEIGPMRPTPSQVDAVKQFVLKK